MTQLLERHIRDAIYGHIIGDMMGVPYEFYPEKSIPEDKVELAFWGFHQQPVGAWSDDTSMMLASMDSFVTNWSSFSAYDHMDKFKDWLTEGSYTSHGYAFDIGNTTMESIKASDKMPNNPEFWGSWQENRNGNGSLMRMLPTIFAYFNHDTMSFLDVISRSSSVTHAHAISLFTCQIYGLVVRNLIRGDEPALAIESALREHVELLGDTRNWFNVDKLWEYTDYEKVSGEGYVLSTLHAAFYCLVTTDSYEGAIKRAISLGEDTDTVAAVTGSLAGLVYGQESIPEEWWDALVMKGYLEEALEDFVDVVFDPDIEADRENGVYHE